MRAIAAAVLLAALAGCASEEKPAAAEAPKHAEARGLVLDVGSEGVVLYASGTQAKLRVVNTGGSALSVCDDSQCMLLDPDKELELPFSGRVTFHVSVVGDGAGTCEAQVVGGGEKASLKAQ